MTGIQIHVDPNLFGSLDRDLYRNQCRSWKKSCREDSKRMVSVRYQLPSEWGYLAHKKGNINILKYFVVAFHSLYLFLI
jgi:hypothetical protein